MPVHFGVYNILYEPPAAALYLSYLTVHYDYVTEKC